MKLLEVIRGNLAALAIKKAEEKIDGAEIVHGIKKAVESELGIEAAKKIIDGPLKNLLREMYAGLFATRDELRPDLVEWCVKISNGQK